MSIARLLFAFLLLGLSSPSWSQTLPDLPDRYRNDVAGDRAQPEFDPLGVRLGSFIARADGDIDIGYNSNLFSRAKQVVDDSYAEFRPSLRVTSDWGRHQINVSALADLTRFWSLSSQDTNEYRLHAGGQVEVGDRLTIQPNVDFSREAEPRGSSGNRNVIGDPLYQKRFSGDVGIRYAGGRLGVEALLAYRMDRYESLRIGDAAVSQKFRDNNAIGGRATLLYKIGPAVSGLVQAVVDDNTNPHDQFCCTRDAHGYAVLGGVRIDPDGLFAGQIAVGFRHRYFESSKQSSQSPTYDVRLQWYPTPLLTVSFRADQQFRNSGITPANSVLVKEQSLGVIWEARRNLNVYLQALRETDDYRPVETRTELKSISVRATYTPRRLLQISTFANYVTNATNRPLLASHYERWRAGLSVRLRI